MFPVVLASTLGLDLVLGHSNQFANQAHEGFALAGLIVAVRHRHGGFSSHAHDGTPERPCAVVRGTTQRISCRSEFCSETGLQWRRLHAVTSPITTALARLDADIAAAEARLADLRLKRKGAEALLEYIAVDTPTDGRSVERTRGTGDGTHHAIVKSVILAHNLDHFTTKDARRLTAQDGHDLTPIQVSNALIALKRQKFIGADPGKGRGHWVRMDAENSNGPAQARPFALAPSPFAAASGAG